MESFLFSLLINLMHHFWKKKNHKFLLGGKTDPKLMNYCKTKFGAKTFSLLNPLKDSHLIGSAFKWKFKAWSRSCSGSGGLSPLRWISTCAELHKACTPVSVLLEMTTDTSFTGFSFHTALYTQNTWWSCYPAWLQYYKRHLVGLNRSWPLVQRC